MNQTTDWKDILGKAFDLPTDTDTAATETQPDEGDALQQQGKQMLDIVLERKGRGGKQATIVTGFNCDDEALKQVASQLKRALSVGGSARGGEILIQGDLRQRVLRQVQERPITWRCSTSSTSFSLRVRTAGSSLDGAWVTHASSTPTASSWLSPSPTRPPMR